MDALGDAPVAPDAESFNALGDAPVAPEGLPWAVFGWSAVSFSSGLAMMNIAEVPGRDSIILRASSMGIAMHAVARASAIMQFSAMTVADNVVVVMG